MNALAAIRGYAEMLREDIGDAFQELDDTLSRLLKAVHTAHTGAYEEPRNESRAIQSEPGFILAVDDLKENR